MSATDVDTTAPLLAPLSPPSGNRSLQSRSRRISSRAGLRGAARFLRRANSRRMISEQSVMVRESAAQQIEERQSDWAYSTPIVVLDLLWNTIFVFVAIAIMILSGDEKTQVPLRLWLVGYGFQCILHMVCVCVEYKRRREISRPWFGSSGGWNVGVGPSSGSSLALNLNSGSNRSSNVNSGHSRSNSSSSASLEGDSMEFYDEHQQDEDNTSVAEGDKASTDAFVAVAKALRNDYEFAIVTDKALAPNGAQPSAVLYRKFDEPQVTHSGEWTEEALSNFVRGNAFPLVGEIGPENYQKYLERGYPLVWIFVDKSDSETLAAATEVAKDFRSSLSLVWLDGKRWADHAKTFGLSGKTPGVVVEDRDNRKNYVFPESQKPTADALRAHLKGFTDKTIQPTVKSEEIPEKNDGPVKVVVGKSFESIVLDTTKDVLIEFYAPWCGHCKSLAPKFDKLGEMFADTPSVVIAKVDATENDTPVDIRGFPTLMFYPANDKANPLTYEGDRTEQAMAAFVRENAATLKGAAAAGAKKGHDEL